MTDFEKMKSLLDEFGVGYALESAEDDNRITCQYNHEKVIGYCFYTEFIFDKHGKFLNIGIWE